MKIQPKAKGLEEIVPLITIRDTSSPKAFFLPPIKKTSPCIDAGLRAIEGHGGGGGIRTHGALRLSGFQDRRNRPLCHPSKSKSALFKHS